MPYEAVIGLEIHVQLNCATKMFCSCANRPGDKPNSNICPICIWLPGAIPQFSQDALEHAAAVCLALNCELQQESAFDQKVYYYPDLPKGFQLSQHHRPLSRHGWLDIMGEDGNSRRLRIRHIHMEEDVAKLVHETEGQTRISLVDFNRAGTPLVEIVTEPDMRSPHDAMAFLRTLRTQIRYVGAAECSMESGTMRCDANISLRPLGSQELTTKVEVKNMNSIKAVGSAIAYEIERQTMLLDEGKPVIMHTRLWDPEKNSTSPMRAKFSGPCVPDPTVPRIVLSEEWISRMRSRLPEMPAQKQSRFIQEYHLSDEEAGLMSADRDVADYFEALVRENVSSRIASQWILTRLLPALRERQQEISETMVTPQRTAALLAMIEREEINVKAAREIFADMFETEKSPAEIVKEKGIKQIGDADELDTILDTILADNADAVTSLRRGNKKVAGFLIGQAMKASAGKANPKILATLLSRKLGLEC